MSENDTATEDAQYWAPHHIRAAVTATGVVLLDLRQNRYLGLGLRHASELATLAANWSHVSTEAQPLPSLSKASVLARAPAFMEAGLLVRHAPDVAFNASTIDLNVQLTSVGLQAQSTASMRPDHVVNFVRACLWSKQALRSRTLYSVACEVSAAKSNDSREPDLLRTTQLVCIFRRLRPYAFESRDRCLFHSLALLRFLALYGSHPTWVIGVCAKPWAAHSWLQLNSWVLDANPEEICGFTPILAV